MRLFIQQLRLLLIFALVLAPAQGVFAAQSNSLASSLAGVASLNMQSRAINSDLQMLEEGCSKHGDCSNCQDSVPCGSCPVSLGIPQMTSTLSDTDRQALAISSIVPLYNTDLFPDYRPPRNS